MTDIATYPLYNSTYSVFRASPLYHGNLRIGLKSPVSAQALRFHSKQLRDILSNESIRGVSIAQDNQAYSDTLVDCSWTLLGDETQWSNQTQSQSSDPPLTSENARGIHIQLKYPKTTHCAMLLRDPANLPDEHPQFTTLPLLLVRMPAALRDILLNYLQIHFDCNIVAHTFRSIDSSIESFISTISEHSSAWSHFVHHPSLSEITQNIQVQIAFPSAAPLLKNLDITIAAEDVPPFLEQGKLLVARQQTQQHRLQGRPFIAALSHYLDTHCGLRLDQAGIQVSKVVCGAFALSAAGKLKIFAPDIPELDGGSETSALNSMPRTPVQVALGELYSQLVAEVMPLQDKGISLGQSAEASGEWQSEKGKEKERARPDVVDLVGRARSPLKRLTRTAQTQPATSEVPDSPPPPYALHDVAARLVD